MPRILLPLAVLGGCVLGEPDAPQLLVPEDIEVPWDSPSEGNGDGRVALVPIDVMIYDGASGEAHADVAVEVSTTWAHAGFVAPDDLIAVGSNESESDDVVWDAWRDRFFAIDRVRATYRLRTDAFGLGRVYVFADSFPIGTEGVPTPIPVVVSMGAMDDTFLLVPR